jgi:hypothetical protein
MAGVRGIEPRSWVLETHVLAVVRYPFALRDCTKSQGDALLFVLLLNSNSAAESLTRFFIVKYNDGLFGNNCILR